jgi:hypothetical protein
MANPSLFFFLSFLSFFLSTLRCASFVVVFESSCQMPSHSLSSTGRTRSRQSSREFNQLQITINRLLRSVHVRVHVVFMLCIRFRSSRWIEKQFENEYVLPNMHDITMKWSCNRFEREKNDQLLVLSSTLKHSRLFSYNVCDLHFPKPLIADSQQLISTNNSMAFIVQWKRSTMLNEHDYHERSLISSWIQEKLLLTKRYILTRTYLYVEHDTSLD